MTLTQPDYYETLSFFPDKTLTLIAQSNNVISGLNLETSGPQLSYFRVERIVCTDMSVLYGPISQVGAPELSRQPANKQCADNRFIACTPTDQSISQFEALYAKKSNLITTALRMLTLLQKISQFSIPDPFAFLDYNVTFLLRELSCSRSTKQLYTILIRWRALVLNRCFST